MDRYIGEINFDSKGLGHITLDDSKIKLDIQVAKEDSLNAVDGHKVVVELIKKLIKILNISEKLLKLLVIKMIRVDILSIVYKYNIHTEFPEDVKEEVKHIPMEVRDIDMVGRRDLRDMEIFTIDGDDTKDIDEAISIERME